MNIIKLVASSSFLTLNKNLIRIFGLESAAIVGMFASIASYNDNDWFYATYERIEEELGLKKSVAAKAIDAIVQSGILLEKREGIPCRKHFKFQEDQLLNFLSCENRTTSRTHDDQQEGDIISSQVVGKSNDIYKNKNKNKSLSIKSEEEIKEIIEREKFNLDIKKFYRWYKNEMAEKGLKTSLLNVMDSWAKKPENQIIKKSSSTCIRTTKEDPEIIKIRDVVKMIVGNDWQYFYNHKIEENTIFVKDKRALQYQDALAKINIKIELK